jgi:hypothetical protein
MTGVVSNGEQMLRLFIWSAAFICAVSVLACAPTTSSLCAPALQAGKVSTTLSYYTDGIGVERFYDPACPQITIELNLTRLSQGEQVALFDFAYAEIERRSNPATVQIDVRGDVKRRNGRLELAVTKLSNFRGVVAPSPYGIP